MSHAAATLGLIFANPLLLGGLGLAALPIVIHLLSRRQFRRVRWGAMRFLLEAEKESRRRVRFEQWLLLALRCLAVALLVLLIARPAMQPQLVAGLLGGAGGTQRVIVVDDSASTGYRRGATTNGAQLAQAADRLMKWLQQTAPRDPVTLLLTSRPQTPLLDQQAADTPAAQDARRALAALQAHPVAAHPARLTQLLAQRVASLPTTQAAEIYFFSDFQRSDWGATDESASSVLAPLEALQRDGLRAILVWDGPAARPNVALHGIEVAASRALAGLPSTLHATLSNFGSELLRDVRVEFSVDGVAAAPVTIQRVEAGAAARVSAEVTFSGAGSRRVTAQTPGRDGLPLDDLSRAVVPVAEAVRTLIVNGSPSADAYQDEVALLRSALNPPGPSSSGIQVSVIDPPQLDGTDLETFDLIMLCNVGALRAVQAERLEAAVRRGVGLIWFAGDQWTNAEELNRVAANLLPASLREQRTPDAPVAMLAPGETSGADADPARVLSESALFQRYFLVALPQAPASSPEAQPTATQPGEPAARVLARFADADQSPALLERRVGAGRVLLLTSTVDLDWNNWARALDGSYVVAMLELAYTSARRPLQPLAFTSGAPLTLALDDQRYDTRGLLRSPTYPTEPAVPLRLAGDRVDVGQQALLESPPAAQIGFYEAELAERGGGAALLPVAVNLDPREADLVSMSEAELKAMLGRLPGQILLAQAEFAGGAAAQRELWPLLLVAAIAVLFAEQTLACWFGDPARGRGSTGGPAWLRGLRRSRRGAEASKHHTDLRR